MPTDTDAPTDSESAYDAALDPSRDPLRDQLLDAACKVFASKGYDGTKIMDIVRESGLSSGAVYGRFDSKDDLLLAAVIAAVEEHSIATKYSELPVAEMLAEASRADEPLDDHEAMQLEAFIAARREPTLAAAITEARKLLAGHDRRPAHRTCVSRRVGEPRRGLRLTRLPHADAPPRPARPTRRWSTPARR